MTTRTEQTDKPKPLTEAEHRLIESLTITGWRRLKEREANATAKPAQTKGGA